MDNRSPAMTNERLAELRALCERATPGPWSFERIAHDDGYFSYEYNANGAFVAFYERDHDSPTKAKFNSDFVSAARTALPELIEELEKARAMLKRLEWEGGFYDPVCPLCKQRVHKPGCELAALIGESQKE